MSVYKPKYRNPKTGERVECKIYWMAFQFHGQRIRESTGMPSITRAREVEAKRKRGLQDGAAGIRKREAPPLFSTAAAEFCERKATAWSASSRVGAKGSLAHLLPFFGKKLLCDVDARDIARYQRERLAEGAANRSVNIEVGLLRSIMRWRGLWARIAADVTMLRERDDVGHALTPEEESALLAECAASRSRILHPLVVLLLETGARLNTIRTLQWGSVDFASASLKIGKDKTDAGTGRVIPLSRRAIETLRFWSQMFPARTPADFVFPSEQYATSGAEDTFGFTEHVIVLESDPTKPISRIKSAWEQARSRTRLHCPRCADGRISEAAKPDGGFVCGACQWRTDELPVAVSKLRLHDLRHSAVSRMIAARIPLPMIAKIVGWKPGTMAKMAARYGHFSLEEMRTAVESIARAPEGIASGYPKNLPKSASDDAGRVQ